jgi:hypothetical protein
MFAGEIKLLLQLLCKYQQGSPSRHTYIHEVFPQHFKTASGIGQYENKTGGDKDCVDLIPAAYFKHGNRRNDAIRQALAKSDRQCKDVVLIPTANLSCLCRR